jgi:toxin HigB-1
MIVKFTHRGLSRYFQHSEQRGIPPQHAPRIERILDRLDAATKPDDMNVPGYRFHPLRGDRKGEYAVNVSGNWRITFRFDDENATDVNLEDYH